MTPRSTTVSFTFSRAVLLLCLTGILAGLPAAALGFEIFVASQGNGEIGAYDSSGATINATLVSIGAGNPFDLATSGTDLFFGVDGQSVGNYTFSGGAVDTSLITGLTSAQGLAVSGSDLFIADLLDQKVLEYTTAGVLVNPAFITVAAGSYPQGIAISGSDIYITNYIAGTVGEYTTSGATVNANLITGLGNPSNIAILGSDMFVSGSGSGIIGEYTTSGVPVNASLITGLNTPTGIIAQGSDLYIASYGNNTISEYTTDGALVNPALITGLDNPEGITAVVPEPSAWPLLAGAAASLFVVRRRLGRTA